MVYSIMLATYQIELRNTINFHVVFQDAVPHLVGFASLQDLYVEEKEVLV